jgi:ADP-ribose pyrophosphatase YjhB (NUDIX family)
MFNVRVYGLLINDQNQILISDEIIRGNFYTKFPGGGLEYGEGTIEGLEREFREELNINIKVQSHFYTTDFYQQSAFNPNDQIISIYYYVSCDESFDLEKINSEEGRSEQFRFINMEELTEEKLSLPIDKKVANLLSEKKNNNPNSQAIYNSDTK